MNGRHPRRAAFRARVRSERGASLVFALLGLATLTILGLGLTSVGMTAVHMTSNERDTQDALALADAGLAHAKKLILYNEWPWNDLTPFLTGGNGVACDGDELAQAPPAAPPGYPTLFIPAGGVANVGGGTGSYRVFVCDDHLTDVDDQTGILDVNPNADVNKRLLVRSVGTTGSGATATVQQVIMASTVPALLVNGNLRVRGDVTVGGAAGIIHANGSMEIEGNSVCAEQYFSAMNEISGGIPEGGAGCDEDGELRPGSAPVNIRVLSPLDFKDRAQFWFTWECELNGAGACTDVKGKVWRNMNYTAIVAGAPNPANWVVIANGCGNASCTTGAAPASWGFARNQFRWSTNGGASLPQTIYYFDTNVELGGNVSGALTILAEGWIDVSGGAQVAPVLGAAPSAPIPNLGAITFLTARDLDMAGNSGGGTNTYTGLCYARQQIEISGSPQISGQVVALNAADQEWPMVAPIPQVNPSNLVPLNAAGQMYISGTPNITFSGNGVTGTVARFWRECRFNPANVNPFNVDDACGVLWGGP